jgi:hypothetical protein
LRRFGTITLMKINSTSIGNTFQDQEEYEK